MAEQLLDRAQIDAAIEQMGGIGMAQHMRRGAGNDAAGDGPTMDEPLHAARRKARAGAVDEHRGPRGTELRTHREVFVHRAIRRACQRHLPRLTALAVLHHDHRHAEALPVDIAEVETTRFGDA